jgi:hypothetical protein
MDHGEAPDRGGLRCGRRAHGTPVPARHRSSDVSLMRRLEGSTARNRELAQDNQRLRH